MPQMPEATLDKILSFVMLHSSLVMLVAREILPLALAVNVSTPTAPVKPAAPEQALTVGVEFAARKAIQHETWVADVTAGSLVDTVAEQVGRPVAVKL